MSGPPIERKIMVWQRDKWRCRYCGEKLKSKAQATVDHVIPRSKGGSNRMANLVTACVPCNQAKADKMPGDIPATSPLAETLTNGQYNYTPRNDSDKRDRRKLY